jgi:hypothetical protein
MMDLRERLDMVYGLDLSGSVQGPVGGSCEHHNEIPGSINSWKLLNSSTAGDISTRARLRRVSLY